MANPLHPVEKMMAKAPKVPRRLGSGEWGADKVAPISTTEC
ncbi:hypothetical protein IWW33_001337 [Pseudomonas sp. BG2dil]|nr:hypothetical protein [Pseudomonas sp. M2]